MPPPPSLLLPDLTGTFVDEGYLHLVQLLGCGGSAKVYKALDTTSSSDDPLYFAVKCMRNCASGSEGAAILQHEVNIHAAVAHEPGVLTYHKVFAEGEKREFVFIVLDLCTGGDMLDAIFWRRIYVDRPVLVRQVFLEVLDAVEDCHVNGVYHRDVKPDNILYRSARRGIRIADFGLATREEESTSFKCGSLAYMSPECADETRTSYSPLQSDLWGLSITLLNLITTQNPWHVADLTDARYATYRADPDNYLYNILHLSPGANHLFSWCFATDPAMRPSLAQMRSVVRELLPSDFMPHTPAPRAPKPAAPCVQRPLYSAILSAIRSSVPTTLCSVSSSPLVSGLPALSMSSSSSTSSYSAGPPTPPIDGMHDQRVAVVDLLDVDADTDTEDSGLAEAHFPPLIPTKLHTPQPVTPAQIAVESVEGYQWFPDDVDWVY
ncbi:kinase-like domain-containing protein [Mycena maculata]|uniref:Kinase-like domain-containing protein n=1 Tax=Mycena maculata TaxID=230809 RepID=A0AAD7I8I4_9AGAR|nr:kinase-like domain-containing protein [Mycena maculata]